MIRFTLLLALCFSCFALTAQHGPALAEAGTKATTTTNPNGSTPAVTFRPAPAFPLTAGSFNDFIADNLEYPEIAVDYAIEGTVVLKVEVTPAGKVNYLSTARPLFAPLDAAAIAAIEKLPNFLPAVRDGQAVRHELMIPIRFRLR